MGSNHQHTDSKSVVLPVELTPINLFLQECTSYLTSVTTVDNGQLRRTEKPSGLYDHPRSDAFMKKQLSSFLYSIVKQRYSIWCRRLYSKQLWQTYEVCSIATTDPTAYLVGGEGFEPPMLPLGNRFTVCRNTTVVAAHLNSLLS